MNWTYMVTQDFTMAKLASYLNMKVLIFAKNENMQIFFKPLLTSEL